jgi:hypothetical protein
MTIWERIKTALVPMGLPVAPGVLKPAAGGAYPERYLVYQVISAPSKEFADNREFKRLYLVQVNIWSKNGFSGFPNVEGAMLAAGFTYADGRDLPQSSDTGHYGQGIDFNYLEDKE